MDSHSFAFPAGTGLSPSEVLRMEGNPGSRLGAVCPGPSAAGIGGIPKVPSMLFDLEMDCDDEAIPSGGESEATVLVKRLRCLIEPRTYEEGELVKSVRELCTDLDGEVSTDQQMLARHLQNRGYEVGIRKAVGGGNGGECLKNLRHSFLRCTLPGSGRVFIIDPSFKEQFDIMHPTQQYTDFLAELPVPIALPEERVASIVQILCQEMSNSFKEAGAILPPWRKTSSMLTKWLPRKSTDEPMAIGGRNAACCKNHGADSAPSRGALSFEAFCNGDGHRVGGLWDSKSRF
ncbi:hypothetical protein BSKO_08271 [Bryopsis sp. KO-2023]|nr:hypothetical protein BSKO_08271 [Bryopsis sp. KO-2023]